MSDIALLTAFLVPALYLVAAALTGATRPFLRARLFAGGAFFAALGVCSLRIFAGEVSLGGVFGIRVDTVTVTVLAMVTFIGFFIVHYSGPYLDSERRVGHYVQWLMATLACVTLLVISNHLVVIALAWVGTSLSLHQLLAFYRERPAALLAAHKKFIASRIADVSLVGAIVLVGTEVGSFELGALYAWTDQAQALPWGLEIAALLFAIGASIKCAQLPMHGWLIQVMEAPTPVSALLHAGVVNLGGFLMIRLSPLMVQAEAAQTFLVMVGGLTALIAALVMTTRMSVKVQLAWSTCAQMGFMLVQCGLGAYSLALLHLVAHSLYKAHAFLSSGSAVERWEAQALLRKTARPGLARWVASAVMSLLAVLTVGATLGVDVEMEPALYAFGLIVAFALTPMIVRGMGTNPLATVFGTVAVTSLYFGWHALFGALLPIMEESVPSLHRLAMAIAAFASLFVAQALLSARPTGRFARTIIPSLHHGFAIDEMFTRLTFRLWPPQLPVVRAQSGAAVANESFKVSP